MTSLVRPARASCGWLGILDVETIPLVVISERMSLFRVRQKQNTRTCRSGWFVKDSQANYFAVPRLRQRINASPASPASASVEGSGTAIRKPC